jgi:hypothetical protein
LKIAETKAQLENISQESEEYQTKNLALQNEVKLLEIKLVAFVKFLDKVLYCLTSISQNQVHLFFDLFDAVAYFLMTFKD